MNEAIVLMWFNGLRQPFMHCITQTSVRSLQNFTTWWGNILYQN